MVLLFLSFSYGKIAAAVDGGLSQIDDTDSFSYISMVSGDEKGRLLVRVKSRVIPDILNFDLESDSDFVYSYGSSSDDIKQSISETEDGHSSGTDIGMMKYDSDNNDSDAITTFPATQSSVACHYDKSIAYGETEDDFVREPDDAKELNLDMMTSSRSVLADHSVENRSAQAVSQTDTTATNGVRLYASLCHVSNRKPSKIGSSSTIGVGETIVKMRGVHSTPAYFTSDSPPLDTTRSGLKAMVNESSCKSEHFPVTKRNPSKRE